MSVDPSLRIHSAEDVSPYVVDRHHHSTQHSTEEDELVEDYETETEDEQSVMGNELDSSELRDESSLSDGGYDLQQAIAVVLQHAGQLGGLNNLSQSQLPLRRPSVNGDKWEYASTAGAEISQSDNSGASTPYGKSRLQSASSNNLAGQKFTPDFQQKLDNLHHSQKFLRPINIDNISGASQILDVNHLQDAQRKYIEGQEKDAKQRAAALTEAELKEQDMEAREISKRARRPMRWHNRVIGVIVITLILLIVEESVRNVVMDTMKSGVYLNYVILVLVPLSMFFVAFGANVLVINVINIAGPISHVKYNSPYYSIYPPTRQGRDANQKLPTVSVQIPVYKESFAAVLKPTLESCMDAIALYREQGGECNIFVNDDGMFLLSGDLQIERMMYYSNNNIAWVARPPENRRGKFKKASNMNFCLSVAQRLKEQLEVEDKLDNEQARQECLSKMANEEKFLAGGPIWVGDYVILLDCDSRLPVDAMLDVVTELEQCPEVAFTQHVTEPMQVVHDYWENCIAHFTRKIYRTAISVACSGGDIAPLVGHNAFLRWSAIEKCSFIDNFDQKRKYWSEEHVSEDFDLAVRMYHAGYIGRYICYQSGWTEGVSLNVRDEITRFQKYAYGACEVLFNPIPLWWKKGIFGNVFTRLLTAPALGWTSKLNVCAYLGTYFALGFAPFLAVLNFFLYQYSSAWRNDTSSGEQWMSCTLVFGLIAPIGNVLLEYRTGRNSLIKPLLKEMLHTFQLTFFFTGIGMHLTFAVCARLLNIDLHFDATAKEIKLTNFFKELKITLVRFKWMYILNIIIVGTMIAFNGFVPKPWAVTELWSLWPLAMIVAAHLVAPLVLNPVLMRVSF